MTVAAIAGPESVALLRQAFDRSFAEAPAVDGPEVHDLLALTIGSAGYALRVTELSAMVADTRITPMATPVPGLLGLAALRGSLLPVYDLAALVGHAPEAAPRWVAVAAGPEPVGLAFSRFDGHLRVRAGAIVPEDRAGIPHIHHVVQLESGPGRLLVSVTSVLDAIADRVRAGHINE
jgi:purine-binding chemotaxis protein CheW